MNQVVIDQLKKVKVADLPQWTEDDNEIFIPKKQGGYKRTDFVEGCKYIVEVEKYIVEPFEGFTLHDNWNKGIPPKHRCLYIVVKQVMGKMIQVESVGFNYKEKTFINDTWNGWLPRKGMKVLEVL